MRNIACESALQADNFDRCFFQVFWLRYAGIRWGFFFLIPWFRRLLLVVILVVLTPLLDLSKTPPPPSLLPFMFLMASWSGLWGFSTALKLKKVNWDINSAWN